MDPCARGVLVPHPLNSMKLTESRDPLSLEASEHHQPLEMLCFLLLAPQME